VNNEIQSQIRRAVSAGEFGKASALWETYAAQAAGEIRAGTGSPAKLAQMRELIGWTRGVVICARAHAQRRIHLQMTKLHAAAAYRQPLR
jgi:hypothetical protein